MIRYLKNNIEDDFEILFSRLTQINKRINEKINQIVDLFEQEEINIVEDAVILEEFKEVEIDEDLANSISELISNMQNQFVFNSLLISAYSYIEYSMTEICHLLENYLVGESEFKDINDNGIEKVFVFLRDNFNISIKQYNGWSKLKVYQKHRNLIIHNDSNIIKDRNKITEKQKYFHELSKNQDIEIAESGTIFIQNIDYIRKLIEIGNQLILSTLNNLKTKIKHKEFEFLEIN